MTLKHHVIVRAHTQPTLTDDDFREADRQT